MKIILAIDGTKQSDSAIEAIKKLNLQDGDVVHIICVADMALPLSVDVYAGYVPSSDEIEKAVLDKSTNVLNSSVQRLNELLLDKRIVVYTEMLTGSPESRIVEKAEEIESDLIIVGSHGYNRWERLLLGSVSDSVIHHAPCSVLVVRGE